MKHKQINPAPMPTPFGKPPRRKKLSKKKRRRLFANKYDDVQVCLKETDGIISMLHRLKEMEEPLTKTEIFSLYMSYGRLLDATYGFLHFADDVC
jgi:hypothetical protein